MANLKLAEQQLIGFAHASKGYCIRDLAKSMALEKKEWLKLRDNVNLKKTDQEDLDEMFGV